MKTIAAGLTALFVAAFAASAKDINLPKIDLQKLCKENNAAVTAVITGVPQDAISTCVEDERAARAEIVKEWTSFPAVAKSRCIQPTEFYPGYVEWLSCLQITRDAFKLRQDNGAAGVYGSATSRQCPIMQFTPDGNFKSVVAC
jgi:putative SOS response-associated peptidase YedK